MVTSGSQSYAIFTYQCGAMQWSGEATIGFIADNTFYRNHILSGLSNSNDIACQNSLSSVWNNVIYALIPDGEISPSPTSIVASPTSMPVFPTSPSESVLGNSLRIALPGFTRDTVSPSV